MDALTKEKKKRLMQRSKGDLTERLLLAYSIIQSLEAEKLQLAKSLYLAANDFTSSNGAIPDWWKDCKEIARKMLEPESAKNTEQDDMPTMQCPKCGYEEEDFDGFGFIGLCPKCWHCNHPNSTLENGKWICEFCGQEVTHRAAIQQANQPDAG